MIVLNSCLHLTGHCERNVTNYESQQTKDSPVKQRKSLKTLPLAYIICFYLWTKHSQIKRCVSVKNRFFAAGHNSELFLFLMICAT